MMRICDAGKHASADLSPAIRSLPALALVRIKSLYEGHFIMFPSIILQIKDMEQAVVWRTKALMILLLLAIKKRDAIVFAIRAYFSVQKRCQRFDQICLFVTLQHQQRAILQMPLLSI